MAKKSRKNYFSFSQFDELGDAMGLFYETIKGAFNYDSLEGKDVFDAIVLTEPIPMSIDQIDSFIPSPPSPGSVVGAARNLLGIDDDEIPKFIFKAKIIGLDSPHLFRPDVCDQEVLKELEAQQKVQDVLDMFIDVIAIGATEKPSKGNIIKVRLEPGSYKYNLQSCEYVGLVTDQSNTVTNIIASQTTECAEGAAGAFNTSYGGGTVGTTTPPSGPALPAGASGTPVTPSTDNQKAQLRRYYIVYAGKNRDATKKVDPQKLYDLLFRNFKAAGFANVQNLILGIITNAYHESGFQQGIVSGASTESSIGLFQMNAADPGYYGDPNSYIRSRDTALPKELQIPADGSDVIVYYAGGRFLADHGLEAVKPGEITDSSGTTRTIEIEKNYKKLTDWETQTDFVSNTVIRMINALDIDKGKLNDFTIAQWSLWFHIYFEQPDHANQRTLPTKIRNQINTGP
jgi:hypothetical protein